jgi:N-methylhydantoinase B
MATMGAGFAVTTVTAVAVGELLGRDERLRAHAIAAWAGAVGSIDVFGTDAAGRRFGTVLLDTMAAGTGAGPLADGIDCGGFLRSIGCVVANVEHTEAQFPLLYLYRRQEPDTGGPGRHRGGAGVGFAVIPHGVDRIETVSPHFSGSTEPESAGLAGGFPGATNAAVHVTASGAVGARAMGRSLAGPDELGSDRRRLPGVARVSLEADDALLVVTTGGGGYGDPIERDPFAVARDVRAGLVSAAAAAELYAVATTADGSLDGAATRVARAAMRTRRIDRAPAAEASAEPTADGWDLVDGRDGPGVRCRRCGHLELGLEPGEPLAGLPRVLRPLQAAGPHNPSGGPNAPFQLEEILCPACARLLRVRRVPNPEATHA